MTIDAGVLRSAADGDRGRIHLEVFRRHDVEVVVPAPALVECTTGRRLRDARMNLVLGGCRIEPATEQIVRRAAVLYRKAGLADAAVDAMVVATSELVGGGALLTQRLDVCSTLAAPTLVRLEGL